MQASRGGEQLLVVCLCAAWCDTCGEFRDTFARLERAHPEADFVWLDIEDDAALVGELDIENFPTLAVYRAGKPLFYGVTEPQEPLVARTLAALFSDGPEAGNVPREILALPEALDTPR